jgi:hypothetical protein
MKPPNPWRLMPHEFFFGLFLVVTWMRLGFAVGFLGPDARAPDNPHSGFSSGSTTANGGRRA